MSRRRDFEALKRLINSRKGDYRHEMKPRPGCSDSVRYGNTLVNNLETILHYETLMTRYGFSAEFTLSLLGDRYGAYLLSITTETVAASKREGHGWIAIIAVTRKSVAFLEKLLRYDCVRLTGSDRHVLALYDQQPASYLLDEVLKPYLPNSTVQTIQRRRNQVMRGAFQSSSTEERRWGEFVVCPICTSTMRRIQLDDHLQQRHGCMVRSDGVVIKGK